MDKFKIKKRDFYLLMLLTMLILVMVLKDDFMGIMQQIAEAKLLWISVSFVAIISFWVLEAYIYMRIVNAYNYSVSLLSMLKVTMATQFFNGITPFATGGQPFQIYILSRETGLSVGKTSSSALQNFILYQSSLIIYGFIAIFAQLFVKQVSLEANSYMKLIIFIGFALNFLVIAGLVILGKSPRISKFFFYSCIDFLAKIRLVKDKARTREKIRMTLADFHHDVKKLGEQKKLMVEAIVLNLLRLTLFYVIAYFLCLSVGIGDVSPIDVILASAYTMLVTSLVPLPGASGGAEVGFLMFFSGIISGSSASAIMLLWRLFTYYIGLILGFFVFTFGFDDREARKTVE